MDEGDMKVTNVAPQSTTQDEQRNFICGVIEGFYGRPWTTEQRKDLFRKLKKWGIDSYVYAPKDDYKHRAYWRELYTVEEADHLSSLITAAKEAGIVFYYALSPGLDITYSSQKEFATLKRKLDQVSQFGCEAFALLFDDIESELTKADKEVFQTFSNAQVSVTNEIYTSLGCPRFLFCPTQYCATRAVPNVHDSEYLNTLGSKLNHDIDIFWTGNKVISKTISLDSIQEVTEVLRRPPIIWDNLMANDYDQKRVFLGPYTRSPELIPHLRGVMLNPNCEFYANFTAIHTLSYWSHCNLDSKLNSSLSADIKLETENDEDLPVECLSNNVYHPRLALKNAISDWLPEFFMEKEAWGPITKPQPQVQMVMPIIPIIPSINTCMSLTTTTTTSTNTRTVPEVNTTQLQALADVCSTVNSSSMAPISNPVMNSLVSPTKVVLNEDIINPIPTTVASNIELPKTVPISIVPVPIMQTKVINETDTDQNNEELPDDTDTSQDNKQTENIAPELTTGDNDVAAGESASLGVNAMQDDHSLLSTGANEAMECSSITSQVSPKDSAKLAGDDVVMSSVNDLHTMHVESSASSPLSTAEMPEELDDGHKIVEAEIPKIDGDDLGLLCDLFYLPFEHGNRGLKLLTEFHWLKGNANVLLHENDAGQRENNKEEVSNPEITEWLQRAQDFDKLCLTVLNLLAKIARCENKEICHDLYSYVWDICGALSLLNGYVKWLKLGRFPSNMSSFTQGSYTWFSKGWKEAFMSGDQEPWVFRGGLIADLQRVMPVDSGNDLFVYKLPEQPHSDYYLLRPYTAADEEKIHSLCTRTYLQSHIEGVKELPAQISNIIADTTIASYLILHPELSIVAYDEMNEIVGFVCAALDANVFHRNTEVCWLPELREKYPKTLLDDANVAVPLTQTKEQMSELINQFVEQVHTSSDAVQCPVEVSNSFPAVLYATTSSEADERDNGMAKRLVTILLAALRANGCFGVHVRLQEKDTDSINYYSRLGFTDIYHDVDNKHVYYGRRF